MSLKSLIKQGTKMMQDPRVLKALQDPRVMKAVSKGFEEASVFQSRPEQIRPETSDEPCGSGG